MFISFRPSQKSKGHFPCFKPLLYRQADGHNLIAPATSMLAKLLLGQLTNSMFNMFQLTMSPLSTTIICETIIEGSKKSA